MTKKTSTNGKGPWRARGSTGDGRRIGANDLFAWAENQPKESRERTAGKREKPPKPPKIVNIDEARIQRAKSADGAGMAYKRTYHARGLGAIVPKLTRKAVGTRSTMDADLQIYWREVVGDDFASSVFPRRSRFDQPGKRIGGVLEVTVERGYGTFMTHAKGQLLDKLNAYFGLGTFRDIKFKEGPLPSRPNANNPDGQPRRTMPLMHIDLTNPSTRARLGMAPADHEQRPPSRNATNVPRWSPPTPKRHTLALKMEDQGGTGVQHKPLAEALTYLGASLANQDVSN